MIKEAPIIFRPYLKQVIWGGNKICKYKGISQPEPNIGESWEISEVPGHESIVAEGEYSGMNLTQLIDKFGEELLGREVFKKYHGKFPLLVKFIDANENLSVQVHPDDNLARKRHNSLGKTEMWYIIGSEKNAKIFTGLRQEMTKEDYVKKIADNTFADSLSTYDSNPGDVFFLPAGRVHAIGAGNLLAEIQESSDITYRIYDYNRRDAEGKTRELHTDLAKDAIDFKVYENYKNPPISSQNNDNEIVDCEHFKIRRIKIKGKRQLDFNPDSFTILMCIEGEAILLINGNFTILSEGKTLLLPACVSSATIFGETTTLSVRS